MSLMILQIDEGERQMVILALAELALSRPGWDRAIRTIVERIDAPGLAHYEVAKQANADRVEAERRALCCRLFRWIIGIQQSQAGDFLKAIAEAALRADCDNYPILRPSLVRLKKKFPSYRWDGDLKEQNARL